MDHRYLSTLDYMAITRQLAERTSFSAGRVLAERLRPSPEPEEVRLRLQETTEAKDLLSRRPEVTIGGARDVRPLAYRAARAGILLPVELLEVRATLVAARALRSLLVRLEEEYPILSDKAAALDPLPEVAEEIGRCLDEDGSVLDEASPRLAQIRREAAIARDRVVEHLRRIVASDRNAPYLQEPIITERSGRYVVPLKAQFKGRIPGIVHDQSSSGATLFIEPLATVELNNRWNQLQIEERHEIERILAELTERVGQEAEAIQFDVEMLAEIDLALAKARYSFDLRAIEPEIGDSVWPTVPAESRISGREHPLYLVRARHPLLDPETVVPIDIYAGGNFTVLLVTGPNTGGKTVALKTVGLFCAMAQAGLHVPALEGSRVPVFSGIYADIGDEQSIEQSLSTFSSHMSRIIDILQHADARSLVLLDELGAGTDPVEGSALAQALIETLIDRRSLVVASTHYSQLKVFAFSTPRVENASVEFDVETLSPTYRLSIGLPGRSNAFAIARRLGLAGQMLDRAAQIVSPDDQHSEAMLARVTTAGEQAERAQIEAEERLREAQTMERRLRADLQNIEEARHQVLEEAHAQARTELEELRVEMRRLRAEAARAPAAEARGAESGVERLLRQVRPTAPAPEPVPADAPALQVGDRVYVTSLKQSGELMSLGGNEAEVRVGGFRLRTQPDRLRFESRPQAEPSAQSARPAGVGPRAESPGMELDMRGWRADEVEPELNRYLDRAYLASLPWVHIIHGKGMGVLRQVVRQALAGHPLVASVRSGDAHEGGDGVTVVKLHSRRDDTAHV